MDNSPIAQISDSLEKIAHLPQEEQVELMKSLISSLKGDAAELISQNAGMKKILRDLGKGTTYGIISRIAEFFHPLQSAKSLLAITNGKIFHMETLYIKTKYYKNV